MDIILCGLSYSSCLVYLDNVIVFGSSFDEQLARLGQVFDRLAQANLKLKPSKCSLCQRSVDFLGNVVSEQEIAMQDAKISAITEWPPCRTVHDVQAFMGLSEYYRRFVKDFSIIAAPLYSLMAKGADFVWTEQCQHAMDKLKIRLVSKPILALPQSEGTYILDTDASDFGLGAILSQEQDGVEHVIAYASRTLNEAERRYETTRKELLAVVYGLKQYKQYLLGRHIVIRTDHAALSWLRKTAEPMPQLARWLTLIEQYDYEVVHRPGVKHSNADGLSRRPVISKDEPDEVSKSEQNAVRLVTAEQENFSPFLSLNHEQTVDYMLSLMPAHDEEGVQYYSAESEHPPEPPEPLPHGAVRVMNQEGGDVFHLAGEDLTKLQLADKEIGAVVQMRLESSKAPCADSLQTESEQTKKLVLKWNELLVKDGLVYRQKTRLKEAGHVQPQLLLPRSEVMRAIELCHAGSVGGHFGIEKTLKQVERRFYWIG